MDALKARLESLLQTQAPWMGFDSRQDELGRILQLHAVGKLLLPEDFPAPLKEIPDPPAWLFVEGSKAALFGAALLAVVGTRKPSFYGVRAAHVFSRALAQAGWTLVSGLARGIDTIAHQMSVDEKRPTIAVLGHGLDTLFPSQNRGLAAEIVKQGGCLITEYAPGTEPLPRYFPRRNRILSGLASGVVVIEASQRSGSLITAHHALEQNRQVFVVPGEFDAVSFRGGYGLIRQGAQLVSDPSQVSDDLAPGLLLPASAPAREPGTAPLRAWLKKRGVASLEDLQEAFGGDSEWTMQLEQALREGWLSEWGPQRYVYSGP